MPTSTNPTTRRDAIDGKLATLCANMKARGITIYTVRVEVSGGSSTVMRDCATTVDKFYDVQNASQLNSVFQTIAGDIASMRISR